MGELDKFNTALNVKKVHPIRADLQKLSLDFGVDKTDVAVVP